jgi:O-acetyl-ADP-ribose deacetylase
MCEMELQVKLADVTTLEVDAIANAANTQLKHGGGVAGAISKAGGPSIQQASDQKAPIALGEAVSTTAGDLPASYVIHAATMHLGGSTSADIVEAATRSVLTEAEQLGVKSLALVAFGTGVGGFSITEAARLMTSVVGQHRGGLERVIFCVRDQSAERAFSEALGQT